ncbi:hypothetical protein A3C09_02300 [Candidatus Uhrbacteria bacterium RIFCSPHIGHO2_02_FULL_47_44]|uniref:Lysozyme inhibitor LprI N-terminal domain-containing protein n=1 Tax=Candidatus Uhrbacteria bacterium RIFCSPLOWO2_02_FULL_48_18 TaxID=1802408 RepID=A0A1F7V721_9BACT|nr:MAG: hypothetical protein A2839_01490 [Candidatus Uhrbacteria bacterium RIFCSPHIGHO2_01_FULL_47_10]OGL71187.1 MAG: hypothetical protein A3C09_02300 [Candidatus Uhrbacteria bacterium RIFCSPHIGHO2_02_FULL_47_44]OGL77256.1 MAG: hypothetical protein A3E97_01140 [Candidatus Uhrbacteria bacterium RIFCSPHIGHO2_12_FULL_47_12]OGL80482.1 MAG: hypothetical protein A3B20_03685 [Candidatus Uhrbacteria bacterium RIFCSPLOWO2_01_FULL_47_17]OGL86342.1 MAG: hypothetical protein A3I41_02165 [Candidatus Uhrbact
MFKITSFFLGVFMISIVAVPAFAAVSPSETDQDQTDVALCVENAVRAREAVLGEAINTQTQSILDAYGKRQTALVDLYDDTDMSAKNLQKEVKKIWNAFRTSTKNTAKEWKKAKGDAWKTFKADIKECNDKTNRSDGSFMGSEIAGS